MFLIEHFEFRAATAAAFLPADFFDPLPLLGFFADLDCLYFVGENPSCEKTVESLRPLRLTPHPHAGGPVREDNARGDLVHVLPAMPAGVSEDFFNILLENPQRRHPDNQFFFFRPRNRKPAHLWPIITVLIFCQIGFDKGLDKRLDELFRLLLGKCDSEDFDF